MTSVRLAPGIHPGVPADRYHADPCDRPSLTASIAKLVCDRSPLHARHAHPRLNPGLVREEAGTLDVGTVAHAMLLQGEDVCTPVDAPDWRTKAAREQRDTIRDQGRVPLLVAQHDQVRGMVKTVREQLTLLDADPPLLADGVPEQTLVWEEPGGIVCRARVDWLRRDSTAFDDLKTTSRSAHPMLWADRRLWDFGLDVQAAFYQRGILALTGVEAVPRFIVAESTPPYAVTVLSLAPSAMELGREKADWAIRTWRECLRTNHWPGYPRRVAYAESPAWEVARWMEARYLEDHEEVPT